MSKPHCLAFFLSLSAFSAIAEETAPGALVGDAVLDCAAIAKEVAALPSPGGERLTAESRGDTNAGGLLGALGKAAVGLLGNSSNEKPAAASDAPARLAFLKRLSAAKECKADDPSFAGRTLTPEELQQLTQVARSDAAPVTVTPFTVETIKAALEEAPAVLPAAKAIDGNLDLKGSRFYVAEYRLLFEVAGEVSASTRGGYLPGRDYGGSRSRVLYTLKDPNVAAFQAIADRAYADFKARLAAAGVALPEPDAFTKENGAVYDTTEAASTPATPVYLEKNGRKYLVVTPSGMKLHDRGFAGLGAGDIGKRIDWSKSGLDGLSISMAVNLVEHGSSGSGSSIFRSTAEASAGTGLRVAPAPDAALVQGHVKAGGLRFAHALPVEGRFASLRETGGYDSNTDGVAVAMGLLSNLAGLAKVSNTKRVEAEIDVDGPAMTRLALKGLASMNQALSDKIKAGL